jgi:type IV pilus assembly protein PilM
MPAHFGLDISSSSLKVAETRAASGGFELRAFGEVKTPVPIQAASTNDDKFIVAALKKLVADAKLGSRNVHIAIPESDAFTRVIEMPLLKDEELKNAIQFESEQYIPIPITDVYLEYEVLFTPAVGSDQKMQVMIVAAKKQMVDRIVKICQSAGLTPLALETALLAAMRGLQTQLSANSLLVDIGNNSTDICIIQGSQLKQASSISTAGLALTRAIAQNLALPEQQAKQYKHVYGLEKNQLEGKVAQAMQQPLNTIIGHIIKNIRFAKSGSEGRIDEIVLSGGTALLPNLTHYLVEQTNIEVVLANPFQKCLNNNLPQQLIAAAPRFASAIGTALRE